MPATSVPVARELTPEPTLNPPAGFVVVDQPLVDGLPQRVPLGGDLVAVLAVPTGLALAWRDGDPGEPVSASADQLAPVTPGAAGPTGAVDRAPVRLFVLEGDRVRGSLPLVAGRRVLVGDDGLPPGVRLEVMVLAWEVRAGSLRGPGDVGDRLALAWRTLGATDAFAPPPVHPRVRARQADSPTGRLDMTITEDLAANPRIGNEAGWLLTFDRERGRARPDGYPSIGSDRFYAEIHASLPSGLEGGVYSFVIEALPDDLYGKIARTGEAAPDLVRLFLFWHEALTGVTGHLRNLAGLTGSASAMRAEDVPHGPVAVLSIVGVSRKAGPRHYETTITARERPFEGLARVPLCGKGIEADTAESALDRLRERLPALREARFHGLEPSRDPDRPPPAPPPEGKPTVQLEAGRPLGDLLETLAASMAKQANRHGRGMMLIRDGILHLGTRPIPFDGGQPVRLSLATGLVEVEALEPVSTDPGFDRCRGPADPPTRRQFKLTLKGRPELKPGDVVRFFLPPTEDTTNPRPRGLLGDLIEAPLLPSLADGGSTEVNLYLNAVEHALSRTAAFTTMLTGVELAPGQDPWDIHTPVREPEEPEQVTADPVGDAARAIRGLARRVVDVRRFPDVGEVRSTTASGTGEPPGQTALVWRGLGPPDGLAHQARRLPIDREHPSPFAGVAYATPFAWGPCGLVLPRYPGTRVLLVHRDGRGDDPVDAGAIWASGHGPADAKPGDWWLILPAEVPEADRAAIPDSKVPEDYTGKATNDLIDADGNRCIEVGRLTVRVGKDGLQAAGTRPAPADADVSIEHADGKTRLVVKADGTIEIRAASKLTLTVEDGPIELNASSVAVKVDDAMDVTGR